MPLEGLKEGKFLLDPRVSHVVCLIRNKKVLVGGVRNPLFSFVGAQNVCRWSFAESDWLMIST